MSTTSQEMKRCSKCKRKKPLSEFYLDNRTGLPRAACKRCYRVAAIKNKYKDIRVARARDRRRYWRDPQTKIAQVLASRRKET